MRATSDGSAGSAEGPGAVLAGPGHGERHAALAAVIVAVLSLAAIGFSWWRLEAGAAGLSITKTRVENTPVTVFEPRAGPPGPTVVIAHGFAGSQQLMQPFAVTLARNGYRAVTFDFPGHGRNPDPFVTRIEDEQRRAGVLVGALEAVIGHATALPASDGRLALVGHSMAGDVLVRYAAAHRDRVAATVLLSPYIGPSARTAEPRDLLFVFGALEPAMLHQSGRAAIAGVTGAAVQPGQVYGRPGEGTARALVLVDGAEHIGVLYARAGLEAARDWLDRSLGRHGTGYVDARGAWLGLLFLALVVLAWPLSRLLPRAATAPVGAGLPWRRLWPVTVVPALFTPLALRVAPTDYLPILLGDYLALHFGLYGLITLIAAAIARRGLGAGTAPRVLWPGLLAGAVAAALYATLVIGLPMDRFVTAFMPGPERFGLLLAIAPGTLLYFAADGWLVRGPGAARGGGVFTKALFLLSILLAVALDLRALFFLVIIVPAILVFFVVYGLLGRWIYARTGHPLVGAVANGVAFAWAIAVTFPVVGG